MYPDRPLRTRARARTLSTSLALSVACALAIGCQGDVESRLAEIRALQQAGQFEQSIEPLRGLVTTNSGHPEVNYRLGIALVRTGRPSLAIWPLQKAADSEDYGVAAGVLLINALQTTQDFEEAIRAADLVLAREADNKLALYGRAKANVFAGRPEDALADADRLLALDPEDPAALTFKSGALADLDRIDEAEAVQREFERIANEAGSPAQAARACASRGVLYKMTDRLEQAVETIEACLEQYPGDPALREKATELFIEQHELEKAIALWRNATEAEPEDPVLRTRLAELLRRDDRMDEAEAVLEAMIAEFDSAPAWKAMATFHRISGDIPAARAAFEEAIARTSGTSESLQYEFAELLIQEGDHERAREVMATLQEPAYKHLLEGSLAFSQGEYEAALAALESGLRRWPNNAPARYMAGVAAERLGDEQRAMAEYREAVRNDATGTDAGLRLAQIYYDRAEYTAAASFIVSYIKDRPFSSAESLVLASRIATATGEHGEAERALTRLIRRPTHEVTAMTELARAAEAALGPTAALDRLTRVGERYPEAWESPAVQRAVVHLLSAAGRGDEAVALARKRTAEAPGDATAQDLLGRVLSQQGRAEEARKAFARATELDPELADPNEGLGFIAMQRGDLAGARAYFEKAAALDPSRAEYVYRAAQTLLAEGDREAAMARLREAIDREPSHAGACNDLAWLLAESGGDLDLALELARRAVRTSPAAATRDTLGWVHLKRGDPDLAERAFANAIAAHGESSSLLYHLGLALAQQGKTDDAIAALRKAVEDDAFADADAASAELARLEQS